MIKAELVIHPKAFITTFRARSFGEILEQARDAQVHTLCIPQ